MTVFMIPPVDTEPWPSLGLQVAGWIEANLVYGPGDLKGQTVHLDAEKRGLLIRLYEVFPQDHPQSGRRRFKRGGISVRKGWAKTEFAAMIAAAELHPNGPVRCVGWDKNGNPVGGGVTDPYIPMIAYTEEQSDDLAYSALKVMLEEGPLVDDFDIGQMRIIRRDGSGKAVSLAGSPDARDGARTTFSVFDETHRWTLPRLKQAHKTMLANLPKRRAADSWGLEITTSYGPGEGSVAESTMEYARAVADGRIGDSRLFFFHRQAKDVPIEEGGYDISTTEGLRAAAIEASGPEAAQWSDIDAIVDQFQDPEADVQYLCRVWFNWITQGSDRAFDAEHWKTLAVDEMEGWERDERSGQLVPPDGELITLGFDGSRYHDSTGIIGTHIKTGYQWTIGAWERPLNLRKDEEWEVPQDEVEAAMADAFGRWEVWRLYADPPYWETQVAEWSGEYGHERVIAWRTNRRRPMASALLAYRNAQIDGDLSHSGERTLAAHIGNACKKLLLMKDDQGVPLWIIVKERPDSPFKIDLGIAGCLSWEARRDALAAGMAQESEWSIYETQPLLVI